MIYDNIGQLIGNTPLVRVKFPELALQAEIVAKVESFNPGGSIKVHESRQIGSSQMRWQE